MGTGGGTRTTAKGEEVCEDERRNAKRKEKSSFGDEGSLAGLAATVPVGYGVPFELEPLLASEDDATTAVARHALRSLDLGAVFAFGLGG